MKRVYLIVAIIVVLVSLVIFGIFAVVGNMQQEAENTENTNNTNTNQEVQPSFDQQVTIIDFEYLPKELTISVGDTVEWINSGEVGHNVIANDFTNTGGLPKEASLFFSGETFQHTFETPGTYGYHDLAHPEMRGIIKVLPK